MWFEQLTGFAEEDADQVCANLQLDGEYITTLNGRRMRHGRLTTPSLEELRGEAAPMIPADDRQSLSVVEVVANVQDLLIDGTNTNAVFMVASQFNLLEMPYPEVSPEDGISSYEHDLTQGPACAIACGAGTIYRNYYAMGGSAQTKMAQLDMLAELGVSLGNETGSLWSMCNGYALPTGAAALDAIAKTLRGASYAEHERLRGLLRVGIHSDTQVTLPGAGHLVTQLFCSALPVSYAPYNVKPWELFARLVLEAAYEATLCAAIINRERTGCNKVFLTILGGGAFGNKIEWIIDSMRIVLNKFKSARLDVFIVSFSKPDPHVRKLAAEFCFR